MIFSFLFACYFRILIFYTTDLNPRINKGIIIIIIIIAVAIVIFIIIKCVHFDAVCYTIPYWIIILTPGERA